MIDHILLLNLLIALLSSTYAIYEQQGVSLYVNCILGMRAGTEYDKNYGALVSTFPPWNLLLIPLTPLYFCKKDTRMLNRKVFHVTYLPTLCFAFLLFLSLNLVLIPFAFLKCLANRIF